MSTLEATSTVLTARQVAERLNVSVNSLAQWRYLGKGPRFLKLGTGTVRYREADVDAFVAAALRTRTDERGSAA